MENIKEDKKNIDLNLESNSKPYLLKRLISDGFDIVLMFLLFVLVRGIALNTSLTKNYQTYYEKEQIILENWMIEVGYAEIIDGKIVINNREVEARLALNEKLNNDEEYLNNHFNLLVHKFFITALCILTVGFVLFLIVPLTNKRRATIGMMLTGLTLFMPSRMMLPKWYIVLYRYLIMMLAWVFGTLWLDSYVFLLMPVLNLIMILINKNQKTIKDLITYTMIIESKSLDSI